MAALMNAIGLASGGLGIVQFLTSLLPAAPGPQGAAIKVKVGNTGQANDPGLGGEIFKAYAWDSKNQYLGAGDGGSSRAGGVIDIVIDTFIPGVQSAYIGLAAGGDAVCIAWVTVKMEDESYTGAWTGDIGKACPYDQWFMQDELAGEYTDADGVKQEYRPHCTWLGDDPNAPDVAAMKFRTLAYGKDVTSTLEKDLACSSTIFAMDKGPIADVPTKRSIRPPQKRERLPWMKDTLVMSNHTTQHAEELCESETSWGPDFVSYDGKYCDMETKTLYTLCAYENVDGCLDFNDNTNEVTKRSVATGLAGRAEKRSFKTFGNVRHWG